MRKKQRIVIPALAAAILLTCLAACKKAEAEEAEYVYVPEYINLPKDIQSFDYLRYYDGKLYFTAYMVTGKDSYTDPMTNETYEYDRTEQRICRINTDGTGFSALEGYEPAKAPEGLPENIEGNTYINGLALDPDGNIWVYESGSFWYYDLPEDFDAESGEQWQYYRDAASVNHLRKLDKNGAEILSADLNKLTGTGSGGPDYAYTPSSYSAVLTRAVAMPAPMPAPGGGDYFYMNGMETDKDGNIYINGGGIGVYVLDSSGVFQYLIERTENFVDLLVRMGDGRIAGTMWGEMNRVLKPLDAASRSWGESVELPKNSYNVYPGDDEYAVFCTDNSNFYGVDSEGNQTKLFNFINCDVDNNYIQSIIPLPDGRILCAGFNYKNNNQTAEMVILTKTPASEVAQKEVLSLACLYIDYNIKSEIINFNRTNGKYRIEVREYSEYNTDEDYNAGLTKLSTEIIAGNIPDILDINSLPIKQYGAKGLLEDLWPFIDSDPGLGRSRLMENVFDAMEQDGKLYQISPRFSVFTAIGNRGVVGPRPGWTVDEMYAALAKLPPGADVFDKFTTRDTILMYSCYLGMDEYVNWTTGKCSFDSESFIKVLEFANSFPAEFDWENYDWEFDYESEPSRIMNGKQLLSMMSVNDFQTIQMYKAMYGGDITFIGFPSEGRKGSAISQDGGGFAMSSKCKNKEGAWEFMRIFLTEAYQKDYLWWGFPTNKAAFDAKLKEAMTPHYYTDPETGEEVEQSTGGWGYEDITIEIYALRQDEVDQIMGLINTTKKTFNYDQSMYDIIADEAAAYFNGQKSARDTAAIIQSRINIYVNEQR